jgi:two-component system chemotaxis response regulator CheB
VSNQNNKPRTRVLIVDDSAFMRVALSGMVSSDPELSVVGTASDGNEALQKIRSLDPEVVTLDVEMPVLNGVQTLRRIMAEFPRPVIMVSSATERNAGITFDALAAGAFDYVPKHLSPASLDILHIREELLAKIKAAAEVRHAHEDRELPRKPPVSVGRSTEKGYAGFPAIVAVGISTGGPSALEEILPKLPKELAVPILVVQHMPMGFTAPFAGRLNQRCVVPVREASRGEKVQPGVVYIAPAGAHMTVDRPTESGAVIVLSDKPHDQPHTPSIDVLMESIAMAFGSSSMGIIMTGMGADGAQGMKAIHEAGGFTVGQDAWSCAVYGMPRVCAEMGILNRVVPLAGIVPEIVQVTQPGRRSAS